jgi:hypothetical protein
MSAITDDLRCCSKGCEKVATHYCFLASQNRLPFCCDHYTAIMELKDAIIEQLRTNMENERKVQTDFMRQIIQKLGIETK